VKENASKAGGPRCPCCRGHIQKKPEDCKVNLAIRDAILATEARREHEISKKLLPFKKGTKIGLFSFNTSFPRVPKVSTFGRE